MSEFTFKQFSVSTAEDQHNYFTGQPEVPVQPNPNAILPPGTYRVIEGTLYRVMGGVAPKLPDARSEGSSSGDISSDRG